MKRAPIRREKIELPEGGEVFVEEFDDGDVAFGSLYPDGERAYGATHLSVAGSYVEIDDGDESLISFPTAALPLWIGELARIAEKESARADAPVPPSIAGDLREPEPGSFDGAEVFTARERELIQRSGDLGDRITNQAVREALADLRGEMASFMGRQDFHLAAFGVGASIQALDRLAERFK